MILGVILARGGSKGVPRKNIKMIAGKPLIAWTIEAAKKSRLIDRLVVSTEDVEIASIAKQFGAEVIDRPKELATDDTTTLSALQHVLSVVDAEAVVLLEPTSPVRDEGMLDLCIKKFKDNGADNLATGFNCTYTEYGSSTSRRQDIGGFFYNVGVAYVIKSEVIKQGMMFGKKIEKFIVDKEQQFEIDDPFDFWLVEQILLKRIKGGECA
ncbi:hypothetical protein A2276_06175 [candidate division WOR-1 bacterium RIFOXYA12_FULL_43_27]|uniref:Acylneuraminate cytidylyltransferase n=1 Tax=candidate division WOR-1 bacterium RIFOXYC2_FULL_46_14 TaxID=1802587 RepID=A0A1F4U3D5_UNCSA|nr:MAG: hypothetical protein A2276_06175 [candidate division WOR-1 bacterium RIFOXYA12_FULL_43_27]OGC20242.1 MAG: hypothetical protein A2292_04175 [candidate division WOR-1 bacterium RIFOXYB2_FULL_46_45]OGC32019.1 MAG: hypothetical protein A2232_07270 [candidate division WOR-1 bacterium RIFOXYA2_FULL_46_56]OGC39422.1 MAG: hypothetical protein A2438_07635 [candidate division WOR-1 bacterium RIFOXYC2_FULL_46_14]